MIDPIQQAISLYSAGQFADALAAIQPLMEQPTPLAEAVLADALHIAASCALALGRAPDAEAYWRQCIAVKADSAVAYNSLGLLLKQQKRLPEAEAVLLALHRLQPGSALVCNSLAAVFQELRRPIEAEAAYRQAIACDMNYAEAHHNLGNLLFGQQRLPEAEAAYRQAIRCRPDLVEAHNNLACVLAAAGRVSEAVASFQQVLAFRPNDAKTHYNLGTTLKRLHRLQEAEAAYRQALIARPNYPDAKFYLATLLLSAGQYAEGWQLYEARYEHPGFVHSNSRALLACPQWQGEDLQGKSLLVWQEDGLGDMLQFSRYLALLKRHGAASITFACDPVLHRLMTDVEGVDGVCTPAAALAQAGTYDCWTSLMSAPWHLRTTPDTIPPATRLAIDASLLEAWRVRLDALPTGRKIGLVWQGNSQHHNDAHRSLPSLTALAALWQLPGVSFVSLQKGPAEAEAQHPPPGQPLLNLGSDVTDLADSAAIISQLDLVICVDTSIAHLAASLRKPCWLLLPAHGLDWRWLRERDDSPWYPQALRLFRQRDGEAWHDTVERVRLAYLNRFDVSPDLPGR